MNITIYKIHAIDSKKYGKTYPAKNGIEIYGKNLFLFTVKALIGKDDQCCNEIKVDIL